MLDLSIPTCVPWRDATVRDDPFSCYRSEFDYLCRTLRRLGASPSDVEDLAHEVFLVLHAKWHDFEPGRPLRPYLFGIAYRVLHGYRRRRREVLVEAVDSPEVSPGPEQLLQTARARQLVLLALEEVPYERRAVFVLYEIDDVAMRDVAKTLNIPIFTAYSRLRKARREFEVAVSKLREYWP